MKAPEVSSKHFQIFYYVENGSLFTVLEYLLAIYEWLPGTFIIFSEDRDCPVLKWLKEHKYPAELISSEKLQKLVVRPDVKIIYGWGTKSGFSQALPEDLRKSKSLFTIGHGISEKRCYKLGSGMKNPVCPSNRLCGFPPIVFSRYIRKTLEFDADYLRVFCKINTKKPTIVYMSTFGNYSFYAYDILSVLKELSDYNVVIKPHCYTWRSEELIKQISEVCPIDITLLNPLPFLELADVVIGDVSGATLPSLYFPEKPLLYLRSTLASPREINQRTMSYQEADIFTETTLNLIPKYVELRLKDPDISKIESRIRFFKEWFGVVDGLESNRTARAIIEAEYNLQVIPIFDRLQAAEVSA